MTFNFDGCEQWDRNRWTIEDELFPLGIPIGHKSVVRAWLMEQAEQPKDASKRSRGGSRADPAQAQKKAKAPPVLPSPPSPPCQEEEVVLVEVKLEETPSKHAVDDDVMELDATPTPQLKRPRGQGGDPS